MKDSMLMNFFIVTSTFCDDYGDNCYGDSHNDSDRNEGDDNTPEANDKDQEVVLNNQHLQVLDKKYGVDTDSTHFCNESLGIDEEADKDGRQSNAVTAADCLEGSVGQSDRVVDGPNDMSQEDLPGMHVSLRQVCFCAVVPFASRTLQATPHAGNTLKTAPN